MKAIFAALILGSVLAAPGASQAAAKFIEAPPLTQVAKSAVATCPAHDVLPLPVITWGGDIATIYANGNQVETGRNSLFAKANLKARLAREDVLSRQLENYLACRSPFLRGTMGMLGQVAEVADRDPRTKMVVIYQLTWSEGGDALVVKGNIRQPQDLKGKSIAVQAYGPHVDYLAKVLRDAGMTLKDVRLRWVKDLTGTQESPRAAFAQADIDAAMVIIPDALALTSGGKVGTGAEDSVKGARILLSTKTASRIISDVYAVRSDFLQAHRARIEALVRSLMLAEEQLASLMKKKGSPEYRAMITAAAKLLLDSGDAVQDTEGMYADASFAGWRGNVTFFGDPKNPRRFDALGTEIDEALISAGLRAKPTTYAHARWDYNALKAGLANTAGVEAPRFDAPTVSQVVTRRAQKDQLSEGQLFSFAVQFKPNQNTFSAAEYGKEFDRAINLAATYGGAVITVEGHADPLAYVRTKKQGETELVLSRIRQSAKNLSLTRANAVRDSVVEYAKQKGVRLDPSQLAVVGHGIDRPKNGMCGADPCAPTTEAQWLANMRVEFRIIQVEAEENVFKPN
jgi:outer membrane protein OmpA-like peptidoglycan-associated protein